MTLDSIDRRILATLQRKGRLSNADLSEEVHLSASACHRRVSRLEADGYIRNYVALLDSRKMGVPTTVFVEITLQGQADEVLDAFEKAKAEGRGAASVEGRMIDQATVRLARQLWERASYLKMV